MRSTVFVVSYGRPLYLWNCLDSLYRQTRKDVQIILIDNFSGDPWVREIIRAFERRGLFAKQYLFDTNSSANIHSVITSHLPECGEFVGFLESDVEILSDSPCWLTTMESAMTRHPEIGMLGSLVDTGDFHDPAGMDDNAKFLVKASSPERFLRGMDLPDEVYYTDPPFPFSNPPGRLLLLRTSLVVKFGMLTDSDMAAAVKSDGYRAAISTRVRHRHLSLLNGFDYPDYSRVQRETFFHEFNESKPR